MEEKNGESQQFEQGGTMFLRREKGIVGTDL